MLRRHPDDHVVGIGVGRDIGVAALGAKIATGDGNSLAQLGRLDRGRTLDRHVLVRWCLVLGTQAESPGRSDDPGLVAASAGRNAEEAAGLVAVSDGSDERSPARPGRHGEHADVNLRQEPLPLRTAHTQRHGISFYPWLASLPIVGR